MIVHLDECRTGWTHISEEHGMNEWLLVGGVALGVALGVVGPVSWNIYIYNLEADRVHPGKAGDYPKLRRKVIEQRGKKVEKEIPMNGYLYD